MAQWAKVKNVCPSPLINSLPKSEPFAMAGLFGGAATPGTARQTDFPRSALHLSVQSRRVIEIHHGTKPFVNGARIFLRHIDAKGANKSRVFHMTRAMAQRAGWGGAGALGAWGANGLWGLLIRAIMILKMNKVKLWYIMLSLVALYLFFGCIAIHEEAVLHGLQASTLDDFGDLIMNYPKFIFNALITSLLNIFSGDIQFPVMVATMILIIFVYHLTFIQRR